MSTNGLSTLRVSIDGIVTDVTPAIDDDGARVVLSDGFAYKTPELLLSNRFWQAFAVAFYTAVNNHATVLVVANFLQVWELS
ncbi:hypothetical protein MTO96_031132 [Rhipicephalus appendiculatus]